MTILFFVLVGGLGVLGLRQGCGVAIAGMFMGFVLWLFCGLFWLVDYGVDCSEDRQDGSYYDVEEKCR